LAEFAFAHWEVSVVSASRWKRFQGRLSSGSGSGDKVLFFLLFQQRRDDPGRGEKPFDRDRRNCSAPDAARGDAHLRGDFQQPSTDGVGWCFRQLRTPPTGPSPIRRANPRQAL